MTRMMPSAAEVMSTFEVTEDIAYLNLGDVGSRLQWNGILDGNITIRRPIDFSASQFTYSNLTSRPPSNQSTSLSLLTYNVGLLDYEIFGVFTMADVPHLEQRRDPLLRDVFANDDIIGFQEVWRPLEAGLFQAEAEQRGYDFFDTPRHHASNGLGLAIKRDLIDPTKPLTHEALTFSDLIGREYYGATWTTFGAVRGVKRGFQALSFTLKTGQSVTVINSHFTAYHKNWAYRIKNIFIIKNSCQLKSKK